MGSVLALSVIFGASSPKGRAFGSPRKLHLFAKTFPFEERLPRVGTPPFPLQGSPFAQKEKEKFTKKYKTGCVLVQNVVSYKGVQK